MRGDHGPPPMIPPLPAAGGENKSQLALFKMPIGGGNALVSLCLLDNVCGWSSSRGWGCPLPDVIRRFLREVNDLQGPGRSIFYPVIDLRKLFNQARPGVCHNGIMPAHPGRRVSMRRPPDRWFVDRTDGGSDRSAYYEPHAGARQSAHTLEVSVGRDSRRRL